MSDKKVIVLDLNTDDSYDKSMGNIARPKSTRHMTATEPIPKPTRQKRTRKKKVHIKPSDEKFDAPSSTSAHTKKFVLNNGIKFCENLTDYMKNHYARRVAHFKNLLHNSQPIFSKLQPSTITASGQYILDGKDFHFMEEDLIKELPVPTGNIIKFTCNFGCKINPTYVAKPKIPKSGRGRKPKQKPESKRRKQGTGKEFQTQITFVVKNVLNDREYQIKLFRNGRFQIPGGQQPSLEDFIVPLLELRDFLRPVIGAGLDIDHIVAHMRNYKYRLLDSNVYVDILELKKCIELEKKPIMYSSILNFLTMEFNPVSSFKLRNLVKDFNPMMIAEVTYNPDKFFPLIAKFHRGNALEPNKKTTVQFLKTGKVNIIGAASEEEVEELYYWIWYMYEKYKHIILVDVRNILNEEDPDTSDYSGESIYDASVETYVKRKDSKLSLDTIAHNIEIVIDSKKELEELSSRPRPQLKTIDFSSETSTCSNSIKKNETGDIEAGDLTDKVNNVNNMETNFLELSDSEIEEEYSD